MFLKLKRVNTLKLATYFGVLYPCIAIVVILISLIGSVISGQPIVGWGFMIAMPFIYAVFGFIAGLIVGGLYNLITRLTGGLEFEFEKIKKFTDYDD